MELWFMVGLGLILWAMYDLFTGKVWLHRVLIRSEEPIKYWLTWLLWVFIAVIVLLQSL